MIGTVGQLHHIVGDTAIVFNSDNVEELIAKLGLAGYEISGVAEFPAIAVVNIDTELPPQVKLIPMSQVCTAVAHFKDFIASIELQWIGLLKQKIQSDLAPLKVDVLYTPADGPEVITVKDTVLPGRVDLPIQNPSLLYNPANGSVWDIEMTAMEYRHNYPFIAWLYNPWTGAQRTACSVGADPVGYAIDPVVGGN